MTALSGSILGFFLNVIIAYTITDVTAAMESDLVSQFQKNIDCKN
jgi:ABC-type lipoprotein release transport system permease subunit